MQDNHSRSSRGVLRGDESAPLTPGPELDALLPLVAETESVAPVMKFVPVTVIGTSRVGPLLAVTPIAACTMTWKSWRGWPIRWAKSSVSGCGTWPTAPWS